ncbi:unnamed protein product [Closterium sp. Yama58-4]|nr:unnamed protein product [Closterium sp. Yama58-4]
MSLPTFVSLLALQFTVAPILFHQTPLAMATTADEDDAAGPADEPGNSRAPMTGLDLLRGLGATPAPAEPKPPCSSDGWQSPIPKPPVVSSLVSEPATVPLSKVPESSTSATPKKRRVCIDHGPDNAKYGRNGISGRDLQLNSMRAHQFSAKHDAALTRQKNLLAQIQNQKRLDDFKKHGPDGARITRLMWSIDFMVALAIKESALKFPNFGIVDKAIRGLGDIVGRSSVWYKRFKDLQLGATPNQPEVRCDLWRGAQQAHFTLHRAATGERAMTVDGVDEDGQPTSHRFILREEPIAGHKYTVVRSGEYVKLCHHFAREVACNLHLRMWDLKQMGCTQLFKADTLPKKLARGTASALSGCGRTLLFSAGSC